VTTPETWGTDVFGTGTALSFNTNNEILTILPDTTLSSSTGSGVFSDEPGSDLINKGNLVGGFDGVFFGGSSNDTVTNALGGLILGGNGFETEGTGKETFNNFGTTIGTGLAGVWFEINATAIALNNHGLIAGHGEAINQNADGGGTINNFGVIRSVGEGIEVLTQTPGLVTVINNAHTGTIKGTMDAVHADQGRFILHNDGRVVGNVTDGSISNESDTVINHGNITGIVDLGGGNDLFNGAGGSSGGVNGGNGNDRLIGGAHGDKLDGGNGNDTLTGGGGADKFIFDTTPDSTTNFDTITDFKPAQHDKIDLSQGTYTALSTLGTLSAADFHIGTTAQTTNQHILYNPTNGFLFYDQDGSGAFYSPIHFATLTGHPNIHNTDFVVIA
jgi:Ca2+-binding RTX toxin-like protein